MTDEIYEAGNPAFPLMLTAEEFGVEWNLLTDIAEQTDQPQDWDVTLNMEFVSDHQYNTGAWE